MAFLVDPVDSVVVARTVQPTGGDHPLAVHVWPQRGFFCLESGASDRDLFLWPFVRNGADQVVVARTVHALGGDLVVARTVRPQRGFHTLESGETDADTLPPVVGSPSSFSALTVAP